MTMNTEKKRAMIIEINKVQKVDETMRRAFLAMGKTLVPMLYRESDKAFQALELYTEILDKRIPNLMKSITDHRMELYTDEEVQVMWDFFLGPTGQALREKEDMDREKSEELGKAWSAGMMEEFQASLEKVEKGS